MLASIGLALTPTLLCAMIGLALFLVLEADPGLCRRRTPRGVFLSALIGSFAFLCSILLYLRVPLPAMIVLAGSALLFHLPAILRVASQAQEPIPDESPLLWRWRSSVGWGNPRKLLGKLQRLEKKLRKDPMNPMLRLRAMELALAANENSRALYHAHMLDEILPQGEAHAHVLWTTAQVIAIRQRRPADAMGVLNRFENLYPAQGEQMPSRRWPSESKAPGDEDGSPGN